MFDINMSLFNLDYYRCVFVYLITEGRIQYLYPEDFTNVLNVCLPNW